MTASVIGSISRCSKSFLFRLLRPEKPHFTPSVFHDLCTQFLKINLCLSSKGDPQGGTVGHELKVKWDVFFVAQLDVIALLIFPYFTTQITEKYSQCARLCIFCPTRCYLSFGCSVDHLYSFWYLTDANELQISNWQKHLVGDKLGQTNNYCINKLIKIQQYLLFWQPKEL